jgi:type VI secretion system protein ImpD
VARIRISSLIAEIDARLTAQVNVILHHPRFRKLEAAWRGLHYLHDSILRYHDDEQTVRLMVLQISWQELSLDLQSAIEFDQSSIFRKVYSFAYGVAGGNPFGLLIGDYEIGRSNEDLTVLRGISQVAAAAFAPFVAAAHPSIFGRTSFTQLDRGLNLTATFEQVEWLRWREFRDEPDTRFIGLTLPHILLRPTYRRDQSRTWGFVFHEDVGGIDGELRLWGSAAWAFAAVVARAFATSGWLADIRGLRRGEDGGGLVTAPVAEFSSTDAPRLVPRIWTDVIIVDELERELSDLGFISLCHCYDTPFSAFYGNRSAQRPAKFDSALVSSNAKVSSMLQYVLCASRFAHYLKVIAKDKVGSIVDAETLEKELSDWVKGYVVDDASASPEVKAKYPLRDASVRVSRSAGRPGVLSCAMELCPHSQMDELVGSLRLMTEMAR